MCDSTQVSLCPSPMQIHQSMWIQRQKNFNQKVNDPIWPWDDLWPHISWGHMCDSTQGLLCPTPMQIHQSMHVMWIQWPFFFKNFNQRSMTPRWPLTPLLLSICDSTQGSLCPSPMRIHQCMWIQWSILHNWPHTTYGHTHTYVQNEWTHSLFLNWVIT